LGDEIKPDIREEAERVLAGAHERGAPVRLLGGLAVALHAEGGVHPAFARTYRDIDVVTPKGKGRAVGDLLSSLGYVPNERFNALNGATRLVFYDMQNRRQIDVFVGEFRMCHRIPIANRIELDPRTVPLAELLLTKLQIVEVNEKDLKDLLAVVHGHEVAEADDETINAAYVASLLSGDWGLWRTSRGTIETARAQLDAFALEPADRDLVLDRLDRLWERVEREPKSLRWRSRSRIGDRTRWYEEPDEIDHAI
jgi:hypothetical protein